MDRQYGGAAEGEYRLSGIVLRNERVGGGIEWTKNGGTTQRERVLTRGRLGYRWGGSGKSSAWRR